MPRMPSIPSSLILSFAISIVISNFLPQSTAAPTVPTVEDIQREIAALCDNVCSNPKAICPPECFSSFAEKRALRVSRGRNLKNLRFRVKAATTKPSSALYSSSQPGVGSTVACESALRSAGTLLSRVRASPRGPRPDGGPKSLRSP
ncbi:hypothetical protein PoB_002695700 [Plakobranchus ocellatus]|uniref:Uncharacterized protein n=1 Tax=Plakobranchus ocellatus TaxID=259542 RepID=A0AAV4A0L3_9GAST|nr:hypothetical protein PoB_002695700 [Plakobranchus ocellatus]